MEVIMVRTVVYQRKTTEESGRNSYQPRGGLPMQQAAGSGAAAAATAPAPDKYADKLIKYVPAEVLAFYTPTAAALAGQKNLLLVAAIAALIATPGYLW